MSITITNPGVGGITVESDPTALKLTGGTLSGKVNFTPIAGVAGINIGTGGTDTASTTAGDIWLPTGGSTINYRDGNGTWRNLLSNNVPAIINLSNTNPALRVTQTGSGHALLVEDSTNPDSSPFVVTNDGTVCVGTLTPVSGCKFTVSGNVGINGQMYVSTGDGISIGNENIKDYVRRQGDIQYLAKTLAANVSYNGYDETSDTTTFVVTGGEIELGIVSQVWPLIKIHANAGPAEFGLSAHQYSGNTLSFYGDVSNGDSIDTVWFIIDNYGFYITKSIP